MKQDFLTSLFTRISQEENANKALEKRKKFYSEIGRKGGLQKKKNAVFSRVISSRFTEKEYQEILKKAEKHNLKLSTYLRLVAIEEELKINEFHTDHVLMDYGMSFKRISNLLRNAEWNEFENKKQIMEEIKAITELIYEYLYSKINEK